MRFKVHLLAASAMLCLHSQAGASTWYVSNTGNNATAAKDKPTNPWQTLAGLIASVKKSGVKFAAGDKIVLACGGIWRESLLIDSSIATGGISIEAEPSCSVKPSIRGSEALAQPTWSTKAPYFTNWLLPAAPAQVFSGSGTVVHTLARYPNIGSDLNRYASVKPASDVFSIKLDSQTTALMTSNVPDPELVFRVRAEAWKVYSAKFKSFVASTGVVTLDRPPFSVGDFPNQNRIDDGDGVVLENKLWLMDADKEWYFKPGASNAAGALYMLQGNVSTLPTYKGLEATVRSSILTFRGLNDVKVTGIDLRHSKGSALEILDGSGASVNSVTVSHAAVAPPLLNPGEVPTSCGEVSALYIGPSLDKYCGFIAGSSFPSDAEVIHSTFNNNGMSAVKVYADATETEGTLVYDNTVSNTGTVAYSDNVLGAVIVSGVGATVKNNTITDSAYNAIVFGRRGEIITGNAIQNYCVRYADCGAIYAFNGGNAVPPQGKLAADIFQNWINNTKASYDARYAYQGLPASFERDLIAAIYLDAYTNHVRINKNYIDYAGIGVFTNGGYKNEISENWLHGMFNTGFRMVDQNALSQSYLRGNIVRDNVVYAYDRVLVNNTVGGLTTSLNPPLHAVGRAQYWYSFTEEDQGGALFKDSPNEVVGSDFFAGNQVTGNKVIEISNRSKQWRVGHKPDNSYFQPEVSLGAWKLLSGSTDVLFRPVSRRLVNVAGISTKTASLTSDFQTDDRTWSFADGTFSIASGVTGCVGNCAKLNFAPDNQGNGFVVVNGYPLNVQSTGDFLHYEYFTAGATGSSPEASSLANVRVVVGGRTVNASSEGDWSNLLGTGTPGVLEGRWAEDFHLPASFAAGQTGDFWIYGNKGTTTYVDGVRVTRIPANVMTAANVFDPTAPTVSALFFNYNQPGSGINQTYTCPGAVPCVDQDGAVFQTSFVLTPGQSKMVFKKVDTTFAR